MSVDVTPRRYRGAVVADGRTSMAVFTACGLVLAVWGTLSPSIRNVPSLDELSL
jgi:hypothetical protein